MTQISRLPNLRGNPVFEIVLQTKVVSQFDAWAILGPPKGHPGATQALFLAQPGQVLTTKYLFSKFSKICRPVRLGGPVFELKRTRMVPRDSKQINTQNLQTSYPRRLETKPRTTTISKY